jgi:hypothetical protein
MTGKMFTAEGVESAERKPGNLDNLNPRYSVRLCALRGE